MYIDHLPQLVAKCKPMADKLNLNMTHWSGVELALILTEVGVSIGN